MESAGARVVPLIFGGDLETELAKIPHLNGVFYAGGEANGIDYWDFARSIYLKVKEENDKGTFYPLWGTCLGMQNLVTFEAAKGRKALASYPNPNESAVIKFQTHHGLTSLFSIFSTDDLEILERLKTSYLVHKFGFDPKLFTEDAGLHAFFDVLAVQTDVHQKDFVAIVEAKKYPFYGVQFHPEKQMAIFAPELDLNQSWDSVKVNRRFADFFVG